MRQGSLFSLLTNPRPHCCSLVALMGIPCVAFAVVLPKPVLLILQLLHWIRRAVTLVLYYFGLYSSSQVFPSFSGDLDAYLSAVEGPSPASHMLDPRTIKSQLPVVKYGSLLKRSRKLCGGEEPMCAVCLGGLEARDKVRELGNCTHAFHMGCIDRWIEVGQLACPLCRSQLVPPEGKQARGPLNVLARLWYSLR